MIYPGPLLDDGQVSLGPATIDDVRVVMADEDLAEWLDWVTRADSDPSMLYFGIYDSGRLVGQIFLHDMDLIGGETLIGYQLFRPGHRGRGIGTRALRLLKRHLAGIPELSRAVIITSVDNVASQRLAQRCGFTYVGPAREGPDGMVFEWRIHR